MRTPANIFLTTEDYITHAQLCGCVVLTLGTTDLSAYADEYVSIWTYKMTDCRQEAVMSYSDSLADIENELLVTGAVYQSNLLSSGLYIAASPVTILPYGNSESETAILSYTSDILRAYGYFVSVTHSHTRISSNTTLGGGSHQMATSVIVDGLEKDLGVELSVTTDAELRSKFRRTGAAPLLELLDELYGTAEKKIKK